MMSCDSTESYRAVPSGQVQLFEQPPDKPETKQIQTSRVFRDPDPRDILIGGKRLDVYLADMEQKKPFIVRKMLRSMDLSQLEEAYAKKGRAPYAPAAMLGLILYGMMEGATSLRALQRLARTDVGCWWVTGGIKPDSSVVGRFIQRHRQALGQDVFVELVTRLVEQTDIDPSDTAGDGTTIQAAASRYRKLNQQAAKQHAREAAEKAKKNPDNRQAQVESERAQQAKHKVETIAKKRRLKGRDPSKAVVSPTEPDSHILRMKDGRVRPAYKASILATPNRFIVGQAVDPSSEKAILETMVNQVSQATESGVKRLRLDGNYFVTESVRVGIENEIDLLCPPPSRQDTGQISKHEFEYDAETDTYECPAGQTLEKESSCSPTLTQPAYTQYRCSSCQGCELRDQCTSSSKGRTIKRYERDTEKQALREVMKQHRAKRQYRKRVGMVEPVFSQLRDKQRLNRFRRRDLEKVRVEFSLHAMAYNLNRLVQLAKQSDEPGWRVVSTVLSLISVYISLVSRLRHFRAHDPNLYLYSLSKHR